MGFWGDPVVQAAHGGRVVVQHVQGGGRGVRDDDRLLARGGGGGAGVAAGSW